MIAGLGTDIVRIERIKSAMELHGDGFTQRIYTPEEREEAGTRANPFQYYAGRWCVKEALSKALGCGIGALCNWQDVSTLNSAGGTPRVTLAGNAAELAVSRGIRFIHVSISHEHEYACATVILERNS